MEKAHVLGMDSSGAATVVPGGSSTATPQPFNADSRSVSPTYRRRRVAWRSREAEREWTKGYLFGIVAAVVRRRCGEPVAHPGHALGRHRPLARCSRAVPPIN